MAMACAEPVGLVYIQPQAGIMMRCALEDAAKSPRAQSLEVPKFGNASWIPNAWKFHRVSKVQMRQQQGLQSLWFLGTSGIGSVSVPWIDDFMQCEPKALAGFTPTGLKVQKFSMESLSFRKRDKKENESS